ncbi:MAG: pyridoxamine 5'-phosphate oxidase family protein [Clostridium sp.]|uniref:pyridoxamine 5'-phosphate oxidase family protein n=1 Tax=Clostridium sp. TaxID=1506 RepID=UPI0039EA2CB7
MIRKEVNKLMGIDSGILEEEIFNLLGNKKIMVLATSAENRVTARNMSCIIIDKKIYFQTDKRFLKYDQILENPRVALCVDNIQIEGIAKIRKHPLNEENKDFASRFEDFYKGSYDNYSHMENEVVIEIKPMFITMWKYENGQPFRDFLNVTENRAYRKIYDTSVY